MSPTPLMILLNIGFFTKLRHKNYLKKFVSSHRVPKTTKWATSSLASVVTELNEPKECCHVNHKSLQFLQPISYLQAQIVPQSILRNVIFMHRYFFQLEVVSNHTSLLLFVTSLEQMNGDITQT